MPTRFLLLLGFLAAGMLPVAIVALVSYSASRSELKARAFRQLESVRDIKRAQLEQFFEERRRDVELLAGDPYLVVAAAELEQVYRDAGGAAAGRLRGLDGRRFEAPLPYRTVHDRHYPYLARFIDELGYHDLLLLDAESGETCFSVAKESDFAAPANRQPDALHEVWRRATAEGSYVLSDLQPYQPSANASAQFVAAPVRIDGSIGAVVALQVLPQTVDAAMAERSGMGYSGETFLVGTDFRLRSSSPIDSTRTVQASFGDRGLRVRTSATERAVGGSTGSAVVREIDGRPVLAAWTPLELAGLRWGLVAEIDEAEIEAQIDRALNRKMVLLSGCSAVLVLAIAGLLSLLIDRRVRSVGRQVDALSDAVMRGDLEQRANADNIAVDYRGVVRRLNGLIEAFVARLDSIPVPVLFLDRQLRIRYANTAACALRGQKTRAALIGRPCAEAFCLAGTRSIRRGHGDSGGGSGSESDNPLGIDQTRSTLAHGNADADANRIAGFSSTSTDCSSTGPRRSDRYHSPCPVATAMARVEVVQAEIGGGLAEGLYVVTASPLHGPDGSVVGGLEVIFDRTEAHRMRLEKQRLEERIACMQRLEAIGTFAGGIAHDFNNILTRIISCADVVQGLVGSASPAAPHLDELGAACDRAADMVGQILTFSRQVHTKPQPLDLGPFVNEVTRLVRASLPPQIELVVSVPSRSFGVIADPAQMHRVLLNLLSNAEQALPAAGGKISIELDDVVLELDREQAAPGAYCVLRVRDSGCGMDAPTVSRIFEPFFTTKPAGRGIDIGLALVHGIVTACGGTVVVDSQPGTGSTFEVLLPQYKVDTPPPR
ncbi:MAG: ATP-binding protein [Pseudomonadota bacterium]